jgi:hypothetical protein
MSFDRADSASSRFVNATGEKKDDQSDEAGRRPPLLSPANTHSVSDDEVDLCSPSKNTSTAQGTRYLFTTTASSLGGSWKKELISNQRMIHPENKKYTAIQSNNRKNCGNQQRGFLYMVFDARPVPIESNWGKKYHTHHHTPFPSGSLFLSINILHQHSLVSLPTVLGYLINQSPVNLILIKQRTYVQFNIICILFLSIFTDLRRVHCNI